MKFYLIKGNVHAYEADGSQDDYIPADAVPMSPEEVEAHINPPPTKSDLLALLADLRWRKETGGITVGGMFVATDDRSKLLLLREPISSKKARNCAVFDKWETGGPPSYPPKRMRPIEADLSPIKKAARRRP